MSDVVSTGYVSPATEKEIEAIAKYLARSGLNRPVTDYEIKGTVAVLPAPKVEASVTLKGQIKLSEVFGGFSVLSSSGGRRKLLLRLATESRAYVALDLALKTLWHAGDPALARPVSDERRVANDRDDSD